MATTITAGNSTNGGTAIASDNTGILELKTGTGSGTTAMTLNASQNVGIGTSSPLQKLQVVGNAAVSGANGGFLMYDRTTSVSSSQWYSPSAGVTRLYDQVAATDRLGVDASGNFQFNSGYGSVATAYGCRAWVNFNGTGAVAIRASGNVSSITDNGTGQYTVNFTAAMPDSNYSTQVTGGGDGAVNWADTYNTTSVRTFFLDYGASYRDVTIGCVAIFR